MRVAVPIIATLALALLLAASVGCSGDEGAKTKPQQAKGGSGDLPRQPLADGARANQARPAPAAPAQDTTIVQPPAGLAGRLELRKVADGFRRPVGLEVAPGDKSGRLFVVEQVGRIWTVSQGVRSAKPVLDLRRRVSRGNEQGLLGLVFHPGFASNRKLYVNFTDRDGATNVVEYLLPVGAERVDESTRREIFKVRQPFANHNAGDLEFGPDGKLYVGLGDGGAGGDPIGAGQNDSNVLGKMLRIDVDAAKAEREIVIKGLRNPWRYHFDRKTGDLYIADVGQDLWEEVDVIPAGRIAGTNLGWNIMEGSHCFSPRSGCARAGLTLPAVEYSHKQGCSITGGEVYRGKAIAELDGVYFYADYCEPYLVRSFRWSAEAGVRDHWDWTGALNQGRDAGAKVKNISAFGHDAGGELYVVSLDGGIYVIALR